MPVYHVNCTGLNDSVVRDKGITAITHCNADLANFVNKIGVVGLFNGSFMNSTENLSKNNSEMNRGVYKLSFNV